MNIIIFSDTQYCWGLNKSFVRSDGLSSWLYEQIRITRSIFDYAVEHNVDYVIHNGDMFEEKSRMSTFLYNYIWSIYAEYANKLNFIFNIGNHDLLTLGGMNSLVSFSKLGSVISNPYDFEDVSTFIRIIPFGCITAKTLSFANKEKKHLLFTHEIVEGLKTGPLDLELKTQYKRLIFSDWDFVFNGHIHKPQQIDNIYNIGSIQIQDWGEAGEQKRFLHYLDGDIKSIEIDHPKFFEVPGLSKRILSKIEEDNRNFYRIGIDKTGLSNSIFTKFNVTPSITKTKKRDVRIKTGLTEDEEMEKYIDIVRPVLDRNKLIKVGKEIKDGTRN